MGKTVDLRTEVPGPKSRAILDRKRASVANFKDIYMPVVIDHGHGCVITDVDGNTFLDWSGGIGCLNVGHTNAAVSRALHEQIDKFLHTDFTIVPYEAYVADGRAAAGTGSDLRAEEGRLLQLGRRGRRERRQGGQARHRPAGRDRLRGRLPRPHADGDVADVQAASVQGRDGAVRGRGLPRAVPQPVPLAGQRSRRRGVGGAAEDVHDARGRRERGCDHRRAGAG